MVSTWCLHSFTSGSALWLCEIRDVLLLHYHRNCPRQSHQSLPDARPWSVFTAFQLSHPSVASDVNDDSYSLPIPLFFSPLLGSPEFYDRALLWSSDSFSDKSSLSFADFFPLKWRYSPKQSLSLFPSCCPSFPHCLPWDYHLMLLIYALYSQTPPPPTCTFSFLLDIVTWIISDSICPKINLILVSLTQPSFLLVCLVPTA